MKNNKLTSEWLMAALVRAIKTIAQTALGMISVGVAIDEVNWKYTASVAVVAGIYSILTSIAGLPEVGTDGTLQIDTSDKNIDVYRLDISKSLDELPGKSIVKFKVNANANLKGEEDD